MSNNNLHKLQGNRASKEKLKKQKKEVINNMNIVPLPES